MHANVARPHLTSSQQGKFDAWQLTVDITEDIEMTPAMINRISACNEMEGVLSIWETLSLSQLLFGWLYLILDLSSSCIQMAAFGHTSTPFCFVIRQLLGFFPGQVHLSEVSFDDIYPVLPWSSWLSLVTSQFPVCCLMSCSRVANSRINVQNFLKIV